MASAQALFSRRKSTELLVPTMQSVIKKIRKNTCKKPNTEYSFKLLWYIVLYFYGLFFYSVVSHMSCDVTDTIFDLRVAAGKIFPQKT